jgi:tetratricopeptide (TPR) repeat protein
LGVGPLVWLVQRSFAAHRETRRAVAGKAACEAAKSGWKLWWRLVALAMLALAVWMTHSLIGLISLVLTMLCCVGLLWKAKLLESRTLSIIAGVSLAVCLVAIIRGPAPSATPLGGDLEAYIAKRGLTAEQGSCWTTDWRTLKDFWRCGIGVGGFPDVAPRYSSEPQCSERPHATNEFVQAALDLGVCGFALLFAGAGWLLFRCYQAARAPGVSTRIQTALAAVAPSLLASVAVASFDGLWHVPGCLAMTVMLAACALRLAQFALPAAQRVCRLEIGRGVVALGAMAILLVGGWAVDHRARAALSAPHWVAFMHAAVADLDTRAKVPDDVVADHLEQVLYWTPDNSRAHLKLATAMLAEDSHASGGSQAALEHARRAVELSPLLGEGYVALAELDRRGVRAGSSSAALIEQALAVRPRDPQVLLVAGREALAAGDLPTALVYWRQVFCCGKLEQTRLIEALVAGHVPVKVILAEFTPDLNATRLLDAKYSPLLAVEESRPLLEYYLRIARAAAVGLHEDRAALLWAELERVHERLGQHEEAIACLRRAAAGRPDDCDLRAILAERLVGDGRNVEAEMHIKWCLQHQPTDARLQELLEAVQSRQKTETAAGVRRLR